jgi:hypothetical protein
MYGIKVNGGTGAGAKWRPDPSVRRCACGGFISKQRATKGATDCLRCERIGESAA